MIRHLSHTEINKAQWDACLQNASNGIIYAASWYLDQVSPNWEALILDDYKAIMPLPVKKKWGLNYLIRPAFCQQLGIFSKYPIDEMLVTDFINNIPQRYRWIYLPLNEGNPGLGRETGINYILPLLPSYDILASAFAQNTKRNLGKTSAAKVNPEYSEDIKSLLLLKIEHAFTSVTAIHQDFLIRLYDHSKLQGNAKIIVTKDKENVILAGALFVHYGNRWIYLLSASSAKGKEDRAMFAIIDKFVRDHAGSLEFLDFEGSMIPELARFFSGFGAVPLNYPILKMHRLPFPLNLMKR